ncbi:hypothetical protein D9M72_515630 [compost metagenome]
MAVGADRVGQDLGSGITVREGIDDLRTDRGLALAVDVVLFAQAGVAQNAGERQTVELAVDAVERRIVGDQLGQPVLRQPEVHVVCKLVESSAGDDLRIDPLFDAEGACLLWRQPRAELAGGLSQHGFIGKPELRRLDLDVADDHHRIRLVRHRQR